MNTTNPQNAFANGRTVRIKASNPIAQILSLLILLTIIVIGFIIFIPLAIIVIVLTLVLFVYFKIKRAFANTRAPNGPLDGRRNVRVVERDD
ncbi:MAG: hypothetical protein P1U42_06410 [Phycisphaerales bacterium]|nr:hypothetical protein [Phycisphaerales bacterium]